MERRASDAFHDSGKQAKRAFQGFVKFAFSGNILDIAFGLIVATAFTTVTTSFISDVLLPPLSVLLPLHKNLDEKFAVLRRGPKYEQLHGYNTLELARADGAVILAYGVFLNKVINFLGLGLAIYGLANLYECFSPGVIFKNTTSCQYCCKEVKPSAIRCAQCTSWLDGRPPGAGHHQQSLHHQQRERQHSMASSQATAVAKPYRDAED